MGFPQKVADEVLVLCRRHCCICDVYAGTKIELHHIKQVADGGEDTFDNCIALCFNCHAEVKYYNPKHPKGRKFTEEELKGHRDKCYAKYNNCESENINIETTELSDVTWFPKQENSQLPRATWGFPSVDKICNMLPGTVALIAGYTNTGKSIYAQQTMLKNMALSNTVLYFHLKESRNTLINNIIAAESLIPLSNLHSGKILNCDEWQRLATALGMINDNYLKLIPFSEPPSMTKQVLTAAEKSNAKLIIIDDFNALGLRDNSSVEDFLYCLKGVAAKTGVIILILASIPQKNRYIERPVKRDIQYEALYRMCDVVQLLYRKEYKYYDDNSHRYIEVIIAKNNGTNTTGTVKLEFISDIPIICQIEDDIFAEGN